MLEPSFLPQKDPLHHCLIEQSCVYTNDQLAVESAPENHSHCDQLDHSISLSKALSLDHQKSPWTFEEEQLLFQLHNQLGNKWSMIAQHFPSKQISHYQRQKSDNCVKNHFYSRLRKALRKLNKIILSEFKKQIKEIKQNVIYKIIEVTELKHKKQQTDQCPQNCENIRVCEDLKNRLLAYSYDDSEADEIKALQVGKDLIEELLAFLKEQRKSTKKPQGQSLSDEDSRKKSKKSSLMRETKNFVTLMQGIPTNEFMDECSCSPHVTTRNGMRIRVQKDAVEKKESMSATPSKTSSSEEMNEFKERADEFLKETGLVEDYFLGGVPLLVKRQSSVAYERISLELQELQLFQDEDESRFGMRSQDHFEDPELDEGKFSMFE